MIIAPTQPLAAPDPKAAELQKAAQKFEAMMVEQMLKTALTAPDAASETALSTARQSMADTIAKSQPFGIANLLGNKK